MSFDDEPTIQLSYGDEEDVVPIPDTVDDLIIPDEPEIGGEAVEAQPTPSTSLAVEDSSPSPELPKATRTRPYKPPAVASLFGRLAKRKLDALAVEVPEKMDDDGPFRRHAILLQGPPISNMSTKQIFEYCAYYSSTEVSQLEWVDDLNCVLVYANAASAMAAYKALLKSGEIPDPDDTELHPCHPLPVEMWPIEERLTRTLGISSGLAGPRGQLHLRWAYKSDVKVSNARHQSKYYEKYGAPPPVSEDKKRRRGDDDEGDDDEGGSLRRRIDMGDGGSVPRRSDSGRDRKRELADLDAELDRFANGESDPKTGKTDPETDLVPLSERLGPVRDSRRIAPLPGRRRGGRDRERDSGEGGDRERRERRPALDKDALDAELESFLNAKD